MYGGRLSESQNGTALARDSPVDHSISRRLLMDEAVVQKPA